MFNIVIVAAFDIGQFELADEALTAIAAIDPRPDDLDPSRLRQLREAVARAADPAEGPS